MSAGKIVEMKVRPSQWAHLSFEVDGTVGDSNALLGQVVTPFNFDTFYGNLRLTVLGNPARLKYDSNGISTDPSVTASNLLALRAEVKKALLDKAVAARENTFYGKYANQPVIIAKIIQFYATATTGSKPNRLATLSAISQNQATQLYSAYFTDGRLGVIKSTNSALSSTTNTRGNSFTSSYGNTYSNSSSSGNQNTNTGTSSYSNTSGFTIGSSGFSNSASTTSGYSNSGMYGSTYGSGVSYQNTSGFGQTESNGELLQAQTASNTDYGYRVPSLENSAQNERAQISLMDEQFSQFMFEQNLPFLNTVFSNELLMLDLDIKRLQVAYTDTILMSPIAGIVTGLYRFPGDRVRAGEPIVRVENNQSIFLIGKVIHRGNIAVGASAAVTTSMFGVSTSPMTINGTVVVARGNRADDARWEVAISCSNVDGSGNPIFPLNYNFDFDDTSIVIS